MNERERPAPVGGALGVGEERAALLASSPPSSVWTSAEPWSRTLLRFGRDAIVFGATMWTLMTLTGDGDLTPARAASQGVVFATITLLARRSGSFTPGAPAIIAGGVTLGVTILASIVALVKGAPISATFGFGAMGAFLGGALLWMGLRGRRQRSEMDTSLASERVAPVLIRRGELRDRIQAYRERQRPATRRFMIRLFSGGAVVLGVLSFPYVRVLGAEPPEWVGMLIFFGMWGAFGLLARRTASEERVAAAEHGLICSACDKSYFAAFGNTRLQKNLEDAGLCPDCGVSIVTEDGR